MAKLYRQGDILLRKIESMPEVAEKLDSDILAEGEATGHRHRLVGQALIYETAQKERFVEVSGQWQRWCTKSTSRLRLKVACTRSSTSANTIRLISQ